MHKSGQNSRGHNATSYNLLGNSPSHAALFSPSMVLSRCDSAIAPRLVQQAARPVAIVDSGAEGGTSRPDRVQIASRPGDGGLGMILNIVIRDDCNLSMGVSSLVACRMHAGHKVWWRSEVSGPCREQSGLRPRDSNLVAADMTCFHSCTWRLYLKI